MEENLEAKLKYGGNLEEKKNALCSSGKTRSEIIRTSGKGSQDLNDIIPSSSPCQVVLKAEETVHVNSRAISSSPRSRIPNRRIKKQKTSGNENEEYYVFSDVSRGSTDSSNSSFAGHGGSYHREQQQEEEQQKNSDSKGSFSLSERFVSLANSKFFNVADIGPIPCEAEEIIVSSQNIPKIVSLQTISNNNSQDGLGKPVRESSAFSGSPGVEGLESRYRGKGSISTLSELTTASLGCRAFDLPCFPNLDHSPETSPDATIAIPSYRRFRLIPTENSAAGWSNDGVLQDQAFGPISSLHCNIGENRNGNGNTPRNKNGFMRFLAILFIPFAMILPFALQEVFILVNHFIEHGPQQCCKVDCLCTPGESVLIVFTYGLFVYIPFSVFTPTLFFLTLDAVEKDTQVTRLRTRTARYIVADNDNNADIRSLSLHDVGNPAFFSPTRAGELNEIRQPNTGYVSIFRWDLPPCFTTLKRNIPFWIIIITRFIFFSIMDTQLPQMPNVPLSTWGFLRLAVLSLPLVVYALYNTRPFVAAPYILLDAFPLLLPIILGERHTGSDPWCMTLPLIVFALERCFWYLSACAMPKCTPVGIKIAVSSTFAALCILVILASSLFIDLVERTYVVIVMVIEIILLELLFGTLFLEVFAYRFYAFIKKCFFHRRAESFVLKGTDAINISTQVRWPVIPIAVCAIAPFFHFFQWYRAFGLSDCRGKLNKNIHVYFTTFILFIGTLILAFFITALIRWKHHRFRLPLFLQDWLLLFLWSWYIFASVPFTFAVVV
ncbi:uncharacterized protein TM35_000232110 [Trypanosoma theileri]|uniref:Transmembrane protein n=1 Tax=Trypanosoma theileri TaxID=67003 RepID=A0A1X0NT06_9TRYP|nr:uncharacterized protein TM35_000232110 [Trypanosoma theileri]ORC87240.1 hypothetical protein TM35_000232110 [Trypanosoma theileri]